MHLGGKWSACLSNKELVCVFGIVTPCISDKHGIEIVFFFSASSSDALVLKCEKFHCNINDPT